MKYYNRKRGFTLVEVMIVMLLLAVALAVMAPIMTQRKTDSDDTPWKYTLDRSGDAFFAEEDEYTHEPTRVFIGERAVCNGQNLDNICGRVMINNVANHDDAYLPLLFKNGNKKFALYQNGNALLLGDADYVAAIDNNKTTVVGHVSGANPTKLAGKTAIGYYGIDDRMNPEKYAEDLYNTFLNESEHTNPEDDSEYKKILDHYISGTSTKVGSDASTEGGYSVAIGYATGDKESKLYYADDASGWTTRSGEPDKLGYYSVAIGYSAKSSGYYSVAIGANAKARGEGSVAIGRSAEANADYAVSIGTNAGRNSNKNVLTSIGYNAGFNFKPTDKQYYGFQIDFDYLKTRGWVVPTNNNDNLNFAKDHDHFISKTYNTHYNSNYNPDIQEKSITYDCIGAYACYGDSGYSVPKYFTYRPTYSDNGNIQYFNYSYIDRPFIGHITVLGDEETTVVIPGNLVYNSLYLFANIKSGDSWGYINAGIEPENAPTKELHNWLWHDSWRKTLYTRYVSSDGSRIEAINNQNNKGTPCNLYKDNNTVQPCDSGINQKYIYDKFAYSTSASSPKVYIGDALIHLFARSVFIGSKPGEYLAPENFMADGSNHYSSGVNTKPPNNNFVGQYYLNFANSNVRLNMDQTKNPFIYWKDYGDSGNTYLTSQEVGPINNPGIDRYVPFHMGSLIKAQMFRIPGGNQPYENSSNSDAYIGTQYHNSDIELCKWAIKYGDMHDIAQFCNISNYNEFPNYQEVGFPWGYWGDFYSHSTKICEWPDNLNGTDVGCARIGKEQYIVMLGNVNENIPFIRRNDETCSGDRCAPLVVDCIIIPYGHKNQGNIYMYKHPSLYEDYNIFRPIQNNPTGSAFSELRRPVYAAKDSADNFTAHVLPYCQPSDKRLKNITGLSSAGLEEISFLMPYNFTFKDDVTKTPQVGVMAQDLQKVMPDAVFEDENGFLNIRQDDIFYALVNAVKALDKKLQEISLNGMLKRIVKLNKEIKELEKENVTLKAKLNDIYKRLEVQETRL